MKRQLSILIVTFILVATASLAFAALGRRTQQSQKQFALLLKATGPEFFKKTQDPDGKQMVEKHFKKLQALTQQDVCLFSGHTS